MESKAFHKLKELLNNKILQRIDRKILTYLVFVGIATVFWFLNELSNNYITTLNYPVRFINVPKNKILVSDLPKSLKLNVNGYGYTLLGYKLSPAAYPLIINIEEFSNNIDNPAIKQFKLQTRYIRESINKQMPNNIEVLDILPDTILFQFANIISKKVAIKPNVKLEFDEQCMLNSDISFKPDSILVSGPNTIIDTLLAVFTKYHEFDRLSKPLDKSVFLKKINKIIFDKKKTMMHLPVSKFTQANFEVAIQARNVPDSFELKTFPRIVKVACLISLNEYDKIKAKDFVIDVDYLDIEKLLGQKLTLNLALEPANVKMVKYYPESVEFILDKK